MSLDVLLSSTHLARWADERRAQGTLPHLVRKLIIGTVDQILAISFPAEDAVNRPGYDGVLQTTQASAFVPAGQSVWEMGVNQDPRQKANADYATRTQVPAPVDPRRTTFVFVTPRRWNGKTDWSAEKRKENVWADVRAYDADDLEQWLEMTPPVAAWACRHIHHLPDGLQDLEEVWEAWASRTKPRLNPEFFLASRASAVEHLHAWLGDPPRVLTLRADSPDEAVGFLAATVEVLEEYYRERIRCRAVVVSTPDVWRGVAGSTTPLVLITTSPTIGSASQAVARGHHVMVAYGNEAAGIAVDISLPRPRRQELEQALVGMGITPDRARDLCAESKGHIAALIELLGAGATAGSPRWADPSAGPRLVPLLLAGAWSQTKGDTDAVQQLGRQSEDELAQLLTRWANETDPPVRMTGGVWQWVSRLRAWPHLSRFITPNDLTAFRQTIVTVLGEFDPRLDLPSEDRWMASVHNRVSRYSGQLREGLAGGLALLATRGDAIHGCGNVGGFVESVVRELFGPNPEPRRWYSLSPVLPTLAEAAPDAFLTAVEREVIGCPPITALMFEEEGMFGGSRHTHLLWALETLAWSPDYLSKAAVILAGLAACDPGGRLANRPRESLRAIFLPWRPHTTASLAARFAAIDAIARNHEEIAFNVCVSLLPHGPDTVMPTAKPKWRPWRPELDDRKLPSDYGQALHMTFERLIRWAGGKAARWAQLVDPFPNLPLKETNLLIDALEQLDAGELPDPAREGLRKAVRRIVHVERSYGGVVPSLTPDSTDRLERIYRSLEPTDPIARHAWLFDRRPDILSARGNNWHAQQAAVELERTVAIRECLATVGPNVILQLSERAEDPFLPGFIGGQSDLTDDLLAGLLVCCLDSDQNGLRECWLGLVSGRFRRDGWPWVEQLFTTGPAREWPAERRARFACGLPVETRTWDLVESWGELAAATYWRKVNLWRVEEVARDAPRALQTLINRGRPFTALILASVYLPNSGSEVSVAPSLLLDVLRATTTPELGEERPNSGDRLMYAVGEVLDAVEQAGVADERELVRLEWWWLPILRHTRRGLRMLHRALSRDPLFFAEVLRLLYRPRHEGEVPSEHEPQDERAPVDEATRARAEQAWHLLAEWRVVPGTREDGTMDEEQLREWVTAARDACHATGHSSVADIHIGQILARLQQEAADGAWPNEAVRNLIESLKSEDVEEGLYLGVLNSREATSRSPDTGGEPELALAERYQHHSATIASAAPRTAAVLRQIAEHYRHDARWHDDHRDLNEYE